MENNGNIKRPSNSEVINSSGYPADQSIVKFHGKTKKIQLHAFMYEYDKTRVYGFSSIAIGFSNSENTGKCVFICTLK